MSRYPRSVRTASVKCIGCNAPAAETIDGSFVCVACGEAVVRPRSGSHSRHRDGEVAAGVGPIDAHVVESETTRTQYGCGTVATTAERHPIRSANHQPTTDGGLIETAPSRPTLETTSPAVAIIARADRSDAVIRTVVRAVDLGHEVLLTYEDDLDPEVLGILRRLGTTIVEPPEERDPVSLRAVLEAAGRDLSLPGVAVQSDPYERIDYEQTLAVIGPDSYVVDVTPERRDGQAGVVTAIPACDEADSIADVVEAAFQYSDAVIVVDDGSDDDTGARAEAAGATVVRHRRNLGYGAALKTAFREASARSAANLVVLDGDGQHDASDIPRLLAALESQDADVMIGSRFVEGSDTTIPLYRRFGIAVINLLMNLSIGVVRPSAFIKDTQSGFRVYRGDVVDLLAETPGISDDMEASVDILYHVHTNGYRIGEVGTTIDYSVESPNSRNPVVHGYGIVRTLFQTIERDRPLTTLGVPGLLSLSTGIGLVVSLLTTGTGQATAPGVAIGAAVLLALGFMLSLAAAVLHGFNLNREFLRSSGPSR